MSTFSSFERFKSIPPIYFTTQKYASYHVLMFIKDSELKNEINQFLNFKEKNNIILSFPQQLHNASFMVDIIKQLLNLNLKLQQNYLIIKLWITMLNHLNTNYLFRKNS